MLYIRVGYCGENSMKFNELIKKVLYSNNNLIFALDTDSKEITDIYKGNNRFKDKATVDELINILLSHFDLLDRYVDDLKKFFLYLQDIEEAFEFSLDYEKTDGTTSNIRFKVIPGSSNKIIITVTVNFDETTLILDDLTKCYSKDTFYEAMNKSIERKQEFVLMKIDIDDFKAFNEKYGHMFGDMILIEIGSIIKSTLNNNGYVARIGGDEFLVLLHISNDYDIVHEACRSLRLKISNLDGSNCVKNAKFTATIGAALYPQDADNSELLLKKVDSALLRGKGKGKNCFIMYTEEKCGKVTLDDKNEVKIKKIDTYDPSITNYNIIYGITEVLNRKSYIKFNFTDSLSLLGNFYMLDRISLIVTNPETGQFEDQIVWNNPAYPVVPLTSNFNNIINWRKSYDSLNMVNINQVEYYSHLPIYDQLIREKAKSILAFELIHEDKVYGQVRFDMIHKYRFWQSKNVSALSLVSKMYAIKLASEYADKKHYNELYIDKETGLYNYSKWIIDANTFLNTNNNQYSVLVFEICNYTSLITALGNKKCDELINKIATWLKRQTGDIYCRVREDMFAVLTKDSDFDRLKERAKELYSYTSSTHYTNKYTAIRLRAGVYIAYSSEGIDSSSEKAFFALNASQDNEVLLYTDKLYDDIKEQTTLELHIEEALKNDEFLLYIQPKISAKTKEIGGAEALTRWNYNFEKILQPYKFIPLFERTGYITRLDYNVFENVCKLLREIIDSGKKPVPISVNVSRYTVDYENYINTINGIRNKYNIPIELIELEITEGMYTENVDDIQRFVNMLRKEGYSISIDDFGSGYSNLNNISNLDFQIIKLDKSLCNISSKNQEIILDAIFDITKKTKHIVVCEGVEDKETYEKLAKKGADLIQGYYFDKPLEKNEFINKYMK